VYQTSELVAKLGAGNSFVDSNFDGEYVLTVSVSTIGSSYASVSVSIGSKCVTSSDCIAMACFATASKHAAATVVVLQEFNHALFLERFATKSRISAN
jgi:hypothetical protein